MRANVLMLTTALLCASAQAGDLDPPAGPVDSTFKTLDEVEPRTPLSQETTPGNADSVFKITEPGSYYLTGNLVGEAGKHGIEIASDDVTLDLMGFTVRGVEGSLDGVTIGGSGAVPVVSGAAVRNGTVADWGGRGVDLDLFPGVSSAAVVERLQVRRNGSDGICVQAGVVRDCVSEFNGGFGIASFFTGKIESCFVSSNASDGIRFFAFGGRVLDSVIERNEGSGVWSGFNTHVESCVIRFNGTSVPEESQELIGGVVSILGGNVLDSTIYGSRYGVFSQLGGIVHNNTIGLSSDVGILLGTGSVARNNIVIGVGQADDGTVGYGIWAVGGNAQVEGNHVEGCLTGVRVEESLRSRVVRNTSANNDLNWSIGSGNIVGPIVLGDLNDEAIEGDVYAGSTGSTDPNANYTLPASAMPRLELRELAPEALEWIERLSDSPREPFNPPLPER